jgi:hypothetical protein
MHSKKRLFRDILEIAEAQRPKDPKANPAMSNEFFERFVDIETKGLKHKSVSNETYGNQSMIYITTASVLNRLWLERKLAERGHRVQRDYFPGSTILEIQVSYFKGFHWDE